jgi:AraC family transcriptional regulator
MFLRIEAIKPKKLVGKRINMTLLANKTAELWKSFMPLRKEIKNALSSDLISLQVNRPLVDLKNLVVTDEFEKWAATEVTSFDDVPAGMETFELEGGLYAVFLHKGKGSEGERTFRYIFENWLPCSAYLLDNRPHFEIIGEKYKNESHDSEEEIFIPVKERN